MAAECKGIIIITDEDKEKTIKDWKHKLIPVTKICAKLGWEIIVFIEGKK